MRKPKLSHRQNVIGACWMVFSMAAFAIEDAYIKFLSASMPVSQVLVLFGLGGVLSFVMIAVVQKQPLFGKSVFCSAMVVRFIFEVTGRLFYVLAIALTSLSSATVILQATPILVIAGASLFFGERVGWVRWFAVLVGMVGVVFIVDPVKGDFSALSLLAVIGMIGFAGRDLASRAAPKSIATAVLGAYGFLAVFVAGFAYYCWQPVAFVSFTTQSMLLLSGAILSGVAAYASLMNALRTGEVSAVTPFRYTRLLFGVACGVLLFGEEFTWPLIIGSVLIVFSGFVILFRNARNEIAR